MSFFSFDFSLFLLPESQAPFLKIYCLYFLCCWASIFGIHLFFIRHHCISTTVAQPFVPVRHGSYQEASYQAQRASCQAAASGFFFLFIIYPIQLSLLLLLLSYLLFSFDFTSLLFIPTLFDCISIELPIVCDYFLFLESNLWKCRNVWGLDFLLIKTNIVPLCFTNFHVLAIAICDLLLGIHWFLILLFSFFFFLNPNKSIQFIAAMMTTLTSKGGHPIFLFFPFEAKYNKHENLRVYLSLIMNFIDIYLFIELVINSKLT